MTDMRAQLSFANLAEIETELLAVLAADTQTSKAPDAKPEPVLLTADLSVMAAAKAVLASGEYKAEPTRRCCFTLRPAWPPSAC